MGVLNLIQNQDGISVIPETANLSNIKSVIEVIGNKVTLTFTMLNEDKDKEDEEDISNDVSTYEMILTGVVDNNVIVGTYAMQMGSIYYSDANKFKWIAKRDREISTNTDIEVELLNQLNIDAVDKSFKVEVLVIAPEELAGFVISSRGFRIPLIEHKEAVGILLAFDDSYINFIDSYVKVNAKLIEFPSRSDIKLNKQGVILISNKGRVLLKGTRLILRTQAKIYLTSL